MEKTIEFLKGKKTYFVAAIALLYVAGSYLGFWELDEKFLVGLGAGGLMTLRAGMGKSVGLMGLIGLMGVMCLTSGCASVDRDQDPVVVRAEQTIQGTFALADAFLGWEENNRAMAPVQVLVFADRLREEFPPANRAARRLVKAYKANRTPENRAELATALKVLEALRAEIMLRWGDRQGAANLENLKSEISNLKCPMLAAAAVSPAMVLAAIDGLTKLIALLQGWIAQAKRRREWTPEEEAAVDAAMEEAFRSSGWQKRHG
jgi:hypothetical protein